MKILYQIGIILSITFIGEALNWLIPLPIPGSIYGLLILFILLMTGAIKVEQIKETVNFFLETMPLFFIPAAVGIMAIIGDVKEMLLPLLLVTLVTTLLVFVVTGKVAQFMIHHTKEKKL